MAGILSPVLRGNGFLYEDRIGASKVLVEVIFEVKMLMMVLLVVQGGFETLDIFQNNAGLLEIGSGMSSERYEACGGGWVCSYLVEYFS